ncbi:MAG TPA: 2-isopropylmalate synthase [Dictyoglomaceae bacterium]|nr:2-isopropylmalate synthase [Dictyoglomaceae bacterium]HPU42928.1 2-isopropylmalate synthase [Dictyoglomaceae bacterium]
MSKVYIFDTTLRDGEQTPGVNLNTEEKLEIAEQLTKLNVDIIEAGFPVSSPGEFESVKIIAEKVKGPTIAALARAIPLDIDRAWEAIKSAESPRIHIFIATSDIHIEKKLRKTREEVLEEAVSAVKYGKRYCNDIEFSAEDASRTDFNFLCRVLEAVIEAGATVINIPDTVGYALPWEFGDLIRKLRENVKNMDRVITSIHCHNDLGLATANSLSAIINGAQQVECTINGLGERAGNTAMEEVVMALKVKKLPYDVGINISEIYKTSKLVSNLTGVLIQPNKAIVGENAFAHESGIHQHGVLQDPSTYEIIDPKTIGISESRIVLGRLSGKHAFEKRLQELGYNLPPEQLEESFKKFKELADKKKEITDRDIESLVSNQIKYIPEHYKLVHLQIVSGIGIVPTATVVLTEDEKEIKNVGIGNGPIDAAYKAITNAVKVEHTLQDFYLKSVTGGTDALGEALVKIADKDGNIYTGRASSTDVIEASAKAYLRAINQMLSFKERS